MKTPLILLPISLLLPTVLAHPIALEAQAPQTPVTPAATYYLFQDDDNLATQVWEETNQKLDGGIYSYDDTPARVTGLQMDNVCYGTFDDKDVAAYNAEHYDGFLFTSYVPWTGTPAECAHKHGIFVPRDTLLAGYDGSLTEA